MTYFGLPGKCIEAVATFNSPEMDILNNLNESTCLTLNRISNEIKMLITKLHVNKACINGPNVSKAGKTVTKLRAVMDCRLVSQMKIVKEFIGSSAS